MTVSQFLSFANSTISWLTLMGWIVLILLVAILQWQNTSKGKGIFAFKFTGKLLSIFNINNPDLFPSLNETPLKKHVALAASHCPSGKSIKQILLLATSTAGFKYLLVMVSKTIDDTQGLRQYWDREAHFVFGDDFIEVYRDKPRVPLPTQGGSFWHQWNILVVSSLEEIQDDLALKKYKWVLY